MAGMSGWGQTFAAILFCVLSASSLAATPLVWDGSEPDGTNWNNANNWTPAQVPTSADDVTIPDAATTNNDPTLPATGACASLTIAASGIVNGSTGTLNVGGAWVNNGTFSHGTSTVTFDGGSSSALSGTGTLNFYLLTVAKSSVSQLFTATKAITVASNMTLSGGEFINGAFTHVITGNFLKSGGRHTINGNYLDRLDVNGNFTVTGGDVNYSGFGYVFCAGDAAISGDNTFVVTSGHNMQMDGSGSHTVSISGANNQFWTLSIAGTSSTVTALTDINTEFVYHYRGVLDTNGKNLRLYRGYIGYNTATLKMVSGATFDVGSDGLDGTYFATWTVQSGWAEDISGGTITVRGKDYFTVGNVHFYSGCNFTPSGGTFRMIGNDATKTLRIQSTTFNFWNLELGDGTNTTTVALWNNASQQPCDVDGTLTINASCALNSNSKAIEVAQGWNKVGSFTQGTGTVTIDGSSAATIAGNTTFYNLRCVTAGKQINFTVGSTQTVNGLLTLSGASGNEIVLRSTSAGNRWFTNDAGTESVSWVNVQDAEATNLITVASGGTDAGNNLRWIFAKLDVHETNGAGPVLTHNQAAGGGRDFGTRDVIDGPSAALTIYIENDGITALDLGTPTLGGTDPGEFTIPASGLPISVAPGGNATCQIAFDPSSAGTKNATITFTHNDNGVTSPFIINVTGMGYDAPTATTSLDGGFIGLPQATTLGATVSKTGGSPFVPGMTVTVTGAGVSGVVTSVLNDDQIRVDFTATATADAGAHTYHVYDGGTRLASGTVTVLYPQQLTAAREVGSTQEPPQNATMGGVSTYLHNGEFRHDLPLVSIPGRMLPLSAGVTYRSQLEYLGPAGRGWTASFDNRLVYNSGTDTITVYSGDGRIDTYTNSGTFGVGPYVRTGFFHTITRATGGPGEADDSYLFEFAQGGSAIFGGANLDQAGRQLFRQVLLRDRYNNTMVFIHNGNGQLTEMRGDLYSIGTPSRYKLTFSYNAHGRLSKITDYADYGLQSGVLGPSYLGPREWDFVYAASTADLTEIKLPKTERYFSEAQGANFRTRIKFNYDGTGNLTELIDARQANQGSPIGWLKNNYNGNGRIESQDVGRTSAGDTTHRLFVVYTPSSGTPTSADVIDQEAHRSEYGLNADGTLNTLRHYTGTWDSGLTQTGPAIRPTDPASYTSTFEYDSEFNLVHTVMPRGNETRAYFDITNPSPFSRGNLLRAWTFRGSVSPTFLPGDQANGVLASFTYTSDFNLLQTSVNPRAYVLGSGYDITTNSPITTDQSPEYTTTYAYNANGTLQSVTSPTVSTTISPDTLNDTQFIQTIFSYNGFGQLETSTDQAGVVTRYSYGVAGFNKGYLEQVRAGDTSGTPLVTNINYNAVGRPITTQDPRGFTYTTYINQLDQAVRNETPPVSDHGNVVYFSVTDYDLNGNVETAKVSNFDENGAPQFPSTINTTYTYNILDLPSTVVEPYDATHDRTFSYVYDLLYRMTDTVLPEGNRVGTDFDELNRAIKSYAGYDVANVARASALIQSEVFYDNNSNVVRALDGRGNDSQYLYDAFDRLNRADDRLTTLPNFTAFAYNRASQVVTATRTGKKRFFNGTSYIWQNNQLLAQSFTQYDNLGRAYLTRTTARRQNAANLGYSAEETATNFQLGFSTSRVKFRVNGQVDETLDDLGYPTRYEYDIYNRLKKVSDDRDGVGTNDNFDEYFYDENGNVTSVAANLFDEVENVTNVLQSNFYFDSINRLIKDESPIIGGPLVRLTREYRYDSRSNLVKSTDRKGVVRRSFFDLLDRPIRRKTQDVGLWTIGGGGFVTQPNTDIDGRTEYDRNSNVSAAIDPTGNKTIFRYDLAERWLQTEYADGAVQGTPPGLKTTAGNGHTVTPVGSTVFFSKAGAYDGNSNLLAMTDENDTLLQYVYDENDLPIQEFGTPAGGNPHGIIGETGKEFTFDGLYRVGYARNFNLTDTFTQTNSVFTTLSQLERQAQWIFTGGTVNNSIERTVLNDFDESGRRYARTNPSGITQARWLFDRKHRPTESRLLQDKGSGLLPFDGVNGTLAEYQYYGGGLLHRRHKLRTPSDVNRVVISDFKRDALLRVNRVRHVRDEDSSVTPTASDTLLGRFDYEYDENSMMKYEARWYQNDSNETSVTPDEVDFYTHDDRNVLSKALYNARGVNLLSVNWTAVENNQLEHSDRVVYARRKSATRNKVNWYRGPNTGLLNLPDGSTTPDQTTNYETTDDPAATVDNPASPGNGSRHNYTTIGQVGFQYDYNRNLLADGTRQFRYNYLNQLRKVWRKSDGDSHGLVSEYQEDAFGRRVLAKIYWELARRCYFDTRFELDVNLDAEQPVPDGIKMKLVDGGMTSDVDGTNMMDPIYSVQESQWSARINRVSDRDIHYLDYLVKVPAATLPTDYLGFVAYDNFEVRIFGDRYEIWNTGGVAPIGGPYMAPGGSTVGYRNIGIQASGVSAVGAANGVYIDGVYAIVINPPYNGALPGPNSRFGTHNPPGTSEGTNGCELLDFLSYIKSFNRTLDDAPPGGGGTGPGTENPDEPRVTTTFFDGPMPATIYELGNAAPPSGTTGNPVGFGGVGGAPPNGLPYFEANGDATMISFGRMDGFGSGDPDDRDDQFCLVNGRRSTALTIGSERIIGGDPYFGEGKEPLYTPAVRGVGLTDATGSFCWGHRTDPLDPRVLDTYGGGAGVPGTSLPFSSIYDLDNLPLIFGTGSGGEGDVPTVTTSGANSTPPGVTVEGTQEEGEADFNTDVGTCACREGNPSEPLLNTVTETATEEKTTKNDGSTKGEVIYPKSMFEPQADGSVLFKVGSSIYQLKDTAKDKQGLYNANYDNLKLIKGEDVLKPTQMSDWEKFVNDMAKFGGSGGCRTQEKVDQGLDFLSGVFDVLGFVPLVGELADIASASVSAAQGDAVGAALSLIATLPIVGDIIAKPIKWAWKAGKKIAWHKFYKLISEALDETCTNAGLRGQIETALKNLREYLNKNHGLNLPAGWCFIAGTPVATDEGEKAIEDIEVGDRVLTPETWLDSFTGTDVDATTWRLVRLEMANPDCEWDRIHLRLLRPSWWIEENGAVSGSTIALRLDELGLAGKARILEIRECPPIKPGRGRVVTGTISHLNGFVRQLAFDGQDDCLRPTDVHPFYSLGRNDWVRAGDLVHGEEVKTAAGSAVVAANRPFSGLHRVYNIEVEHEHVYYAGAGQMLVHNACPTQALDDLATTGKIKNYPDGTFKGLGIDRHHLLPQALRDKFQAIPGVKNIDDWMVPLDKQFHQKIHNEGKWNKEWEDWFAGFKGKNPPTIEDMRKQLSEMIEKHGIAENIK